MKTYPNEPATGFSTQCSDVTGTTLEHFNGLTKLEAFTLAAISAGKSAKDSVSLAYEVIKELNNE